MVKRLIQMHAVSVRHSPRKFENFGLNERLVFEQSVAALLAMDVYDGVDSYIPRSSFELPFKIFERGPPESSDDGFFAAAYLVGGKFFISYRGTDNLLWGTGTDLWNGYPTC